MAAARGAPGADRLRRFRADPLLSAQPGAAGLGGASRGAGRVRRPGDHRALSGPGADRLARRPRPGRVRRRADLGGAGDQHDHALSRRRAGRPLRAGPGAGDPCPPRPGARLPPRHRRAAVRRRPGRHHGAGRALDPPGRPGRALRSPPVASESPSRRTIRRRGMRAWRRWAVPCRCSANGWAKRSPPTGRAPNRLRMPPGGRSPRDRRSRARSPRRSRWSPG